MDWHASENIIDTQEKFDWYFRSRTFWEQLKEFLFGKETVDHHFDRKRRA